jgi:hypothetical protein
MGKCECNSECDGEMAKQLLREVGKAIGILQMSEITIVTKEDAEGGVPLSAIILELEGYKKASVILETIYSFIIKGAHA